MAHIPIENNVIIYYLWKVNKNDVPQFTGTQFQHLFFITDVEIRDQKNNVLIKKHGYLKAELIAKSFDKNKLIKKALKYNTAK